MRDDGAFDNNPNITRTALAELHDELFGWCLSRANGDFAAAEDLLQQAYVEVLGGRARFDGRSGLKTFMFGVVQNLARSRYRRILRHLRLLRAGAAESVSPAAPETGDEREATAVWAAVANLPARQRDITELVFCRDLTIEQAAAVMGISVGSGRTHYARAKAALSRSLACLEESSAGEVLP